ncbi:MAG: Stk1 family PASTA domain-containing Ser/Thr kinase [Fastidiosipilaceae bacterium]|jgi:serine/threonine protein kinase
MEEVTRSTITTGTKLDNHYQIIRLIGTGGMALVYLAVDQRTGRDVAVKILKTELAQDEEFVRRFDTEAKAASSLSHPNIVKVLDVGEDKGVRYMIQEYIEGTTLKELIDHYGRLDWRVAVPVGTQIALALENAHAAGIVHRDIKPHNIMVTPDRKALVTDFGIARASTSNTITLTSGNAMGSVHYFSPEQARGGMVGEKADIYSLGILMYEMLTGDVPFDGETPVAVAIKHLQEQPKPPHELYSDIPIGISNIIMKCIRKSQSERYASARELINELDSFMLNPDGDYGVVDVTDDFAATTNQGNSLMEETNYQKVKELEKSIHQRRSSRKKETGLVVAVVTVLALLIVAGVILMARSMHSKQVVGADYEMPNFVGVTLPEALAELQKNGIDTSKVRISQTPSDSYPANQIVEQYPEEGKMIKPTSITDISLVVSEGADKLRLKDYTFAEFNAVWKELSSSEFNYDVKVVHENNSEVPVNHIIRTDPAAGTVMSVGATITLYVSDGMEDVEVPDIKGKQRDVAIKMLTEANLNADITVDSANPDLPAADQYVINFSPGSGTKVPAGTTIRIVFGSHSEAFPTTTTTTEATTTRPPTTLPPTTTTTEPPTTTTTAPPATTPPTTESAPPTTVPPSSEPPAISSNSASTDSGVSPGPYNQYQRPANAFGPPDAAVIDE